MAATLLLCVATLMCAPEARQDGAATQGRVAERDRNLPAEPVQDAQHAPDDDVAELGRRSLTVPVDGVVRTQLTPTFMQSRGDHPHEALDILAPRGTPIVAVEDGAIVKLFTSKPGGLTIYQFDPTQRYAYYYAHLDRYADQLAEHQQVRRGDVLGYVGTTGNANPSQPHLHFAIFKLGPEKQWWKGVPLDPYPVLTFGATATSGSRP